jgi:hypothetical protein
MKPITPVLSSVENHLSKMSTQFQVKTNNAGAMKEVFSHPKLKTGKLRNTGELNLRQSELERLKLLLNKKE